MNLRPVMLSILLAAIVTTAPAAAEAAAYAVGIQAPRGVAFVGLANFDRRVSAVTFAPGTEVGTANAITVAVTPASLEPAAWVLIIAAFGLAGAALRTRRPPASA